MRADLAEFGFAAARQPAFAKIERRDQGAVNQQIGIAPDRRGEMRIALEAEAEMAEIMG